MERITFIDNNDFAEYVANEYEFEDMQILDNSISINIDDISVLDMIRLNYEVNNITVIKYDNRYIELTCL